MSAAPPLPPDEYAPPQMARRVETVGVAKAAMPALQTFVLGVLAGAFIAFGAMLFTLVMTQPGLSFGPARLLGGVAFSLGLVLVIVGGAELFTGNNLIAMAWADGKVSTAGLLRNWALVYAGNFAGALGSAVLVFLSGTLALQDNAVAITALKLAAGKATLGAQEAFFRGVLCNTLVCLAVWMCFAARSAGDKVLVIVLPITAFVALGFEHSVANMYFIPVGMLLATFEPGVAAAAGVESGTLALSGLLANLVPVTLGNMVGGSLLVALVYYLVYLRGR